MLTPTSCYLLAVVAGYLLGSCPNGFLIGRARGVDIRLHGSGNIGATNVLRVVGKKWGYLVFFLDALKGFLAVRLAYELVAAAPLAHHQELVGITTAVACILGHTFSIWLKFRGGKGVATSAGVLLGLMPIAVVSVFLVWAIIYRATRYVSLASITAAISLPLLVALYLHLNYLHGSSLLLFSILIATVVVWRHRSNIHSLLHGTEHRFGEKP
ncbi:MAG: glycerol-3-phosphate 1-O-acyltransferase PlsY [Bryobacteraceae bacterium]